MARIADYYIDEVRKQYDEYYATWLPGKPMRLGDIGYIEKNQFNYIGNLKQRGIKFSVRKDKSPMPLQFNSTDGLNFIFKPSGKINPKLPNIPSAEVGIGLEFGNKGKFFFKANQIYLHSIGDLIELGKNIGAFFENTDFDKKYVIIDRLIESPSASIFISKKKNSLVELTVKSNIPLEKIDLADAKIELSVKSSSGVSLDSSEIIDATPFFGVRSIPQLIQIASIFKPAVVQPMMQGRGIDLGLDTQQTIKKQGTRSVDLLLTQSMVKPSPLAKEM